MYVINFKLSTRTERFEPLYMYFTLCFTVFSDKYCTKQTFILEKICTYLKETMVMHYTLLVM